MPWTPKEAARFTKKATTPKSKRTFAKVANKALKFYGDEGKAIKVANAAVAKQRAKVRTRSRSKCR